MFLHNRFWFSNSDLVLVKPGLEQVQRANDLCDEAELKVLRLGALLFNSALLEEAQLVALRLKEQQLMLFGERPPRSWFDDFGLRVEPIFAEHIHRFLLFLAMLWQKLLESLLFSRNASGFPNKHRPPCTTMPWNIRPTLVIL